MEICIINYIANFNQLSIMSIMSIIKYAEGTFYEPISEKLFTLFAAADCTGGGVWDTSEALGGDNSTTSSSPMIPESMSITLDTALSLFWISSWN